MWLITREINQYDQEGEYFIAIFVEKPDFHQLKAIIKADDITIGKLTRGGGRQDVEYEWYNLREVNEGINYHGFFNNDGE